MAEIVYNVGSGKVAAGVITAGTANLGAALVITSKTGADAKTLTTMAAIDAVGTVAFHSQRLTLTGVTVTIDQVNNRVNFDCADLAFSAAAGVTALALIIFDQTTNTSDTTRIPMFFYDTGFGAGLAMDGGLNITVPDFYRLS